MVSINALKKFESLKNLDEHQLSVIQSCSTEKEYLRGDKIFGEGEAAAYLWMVFGGQIDLRFDLPEQADLKNDSYVLFAEQDVPRFDSKDYSTSEENSISTISQGMIFGWGSFVPPYTYSLSAYCKSTKCRVVKIERQALMELFEKDPKIGYIFMSNITTVVGKRFHQLQQEIVKRKENEMMFQW